jgi:hypothetical protein
MQGTVLLLALVLCVYCEVVYIYKHIRIIKNITYEQGIHLHKNKSVKKVTVQSYIICTTTENTNVL